MKMSGTRREVLRLYKTIMRLGQRWEASNPIETRVEREYIADEARLAEKVTFFCPKQRKFEYFSRLKSRYGSNWRCRNLHVKLTVIDFAKSAIGLLKGFD